MDKQVVGIEEENSSSVLESWLDLEQLAQVKISSEHDQFPIESALLPGGERGWRAAAPGSQLISLHFRAPQSVHRIYLVFREEERQRTQEFVLRWRPKGSDRSFDIIRQQYVFSPPGTFEEVEDYRVDLNELLILELYIVPDVGDETAIASLRRLRLA